MPRLAANLSLLFTERPLLERFGLAARAGFAAVEIQFPYELAAAAIGHELDRHGLQLVLHNLPAGDWAKGERGIACHPDRIDEFRRGVAQAIEYAVALKVPQLNCLAGIVPAGVSREQARRTLLINLRYAATQLQEHGLRLLVEAINSLDVPGFLLDRSSATLELIAELGVANVALQYDVYHMQRMEGGLAHTLQNHIKQIGHIQIADNPGRHEPGSGEIHVPFLFELLERIGYSGWIGCEYIPATTTEAGLAWAAPWLRTTPIKDPAEFLQGLFSAGVASVQAARCLPAHLPAPPRGRTLVIGAGKAAAAMAAVVDSHWPADAPLAGLVITRHGHGCSAGRIRVAAAAHPLPDAAGVAASLEILELLKGLTSDDLVLCLISGGGSALLAQPAPGLTLAEKGEVTRALLNCGARIAEINTVRKHLSAIKGGRLALACAPARLLTLAISDVPGDAAATIASGPTLADPTTRQEALAILDKYQIDAPASARQWLACDASETPKPGDVRFANSATRVIATAQQALQAAAERARQQGVTPLILGDTIEGESRDVAAVHAALVRQILDHAQPVSRPCVILSGGETTVRVRGPGRGGRNSEFLLALALALGEEKRPVWALACDTDGIDGTEDNAGAWFGPTTLERAAQHGLNPYQALAENNAYGFFAALQQLVMTGPTRTNVNDFRAIFIP